MCVHETEDEALEHAALDQKEKEEREQWQKMMNEDPEFIEWLDSLEKERE